MSSTSGPAASTVTEEAARDFLFGDVNKLHDPYLMKGMDKSVESTTIHRLPDFVGYVF